MTKITFGTTMKIDYTGLGDIVCPEVIIYGDQRYVVEPFAEDLSAPEFKVGDFVRVVRDDMSPEMVGKTGKVVAINDHEYELVGVEFSEYNLATLHNLMGACDDGHGRWFGDINENTLELVD